MPHRFLSMLGRGMIIGGIATLIFPLLFVSYSAYSSHALKTQAQPNFELNETRTNPQIDDQEYTLYNKEESSAMTYTTGLYPDSAPNLKESLKPGQIIGKLDIPTLGISEPILEGTGQIELAKSPGHLSESVLPGQLGTSVIAAHNATTFRNLDRLLEGDKFTVTTTQGTFTFKVTAQHILIVGDPLTNMVYPSIALETCYPLNAMYLTNKRLFVEAALVKSELREIIRNNFRPSTR